MKHSSKEVNQWPAISHEEVVWEGTNAGDSANDRARKHNKAGDVQEKRNQVRSTRGLAASSKDNRDHDGNPEAHSTEANAAKAAGTAPESESSASTQAKNRSTKTYYQAALPLLIAERSVAIPDELSTRISSILVEMARFDVELAQRQSNVSTMLLRSESAASSQIDRLMSTPQNVALAELYAKAPEDAQFVLANMVATERALELPAGLTLEGILEIHDALVAPQEGEAGMQTLRSSLLASTANPGSAPAQHSDPLAHLENANSFNALIAQGMTPAQALEVVHGNREAGTSTPAPTQPGTQAKNKAATQAAAKRNAQTNTNSARERLRQKPVWLGGTSFTPHTALFVPPAFHRVPEYLEDLIEFGTRSDLNPLVKAAILYAQFVTVHPFLIGSGQTGRALIHHIFREDGILSSTIIPVSVGFLHNIDSLLDALQLYREGDPTAIVEELVSALEVALYISQVTESSVESLLEDWDGLVGHRKGSKIRQLPKALVKQPVVNSAYLANTLGVTQRTATTLILRACEYGMLRKMGKKERGDFYQSDAIINVLDEINEASTFRTIRV